jgi:hypothetical protein
MRCNTCGRQISNEAANFCEYCGASFREQAQTGPNPEASQPFHNGYNGQEQASSPFAVPGMQQGQMFGQQTFTQQNVQPITGKENPISFLDWLGSYLILFVPIANIVMLVIWAFSYNTPASKKNWARATLIFLIVLFLLFIMYMAYVMSTPIFQDMMKQYGATYPQ